MNKRLPYTLLSVLLLSWQPLGAKSPLLTPPSTPVLGELDPFLLKTLYKTDDPDTGLKALQSDLVFAALVQKHNLALFGGPMLGCVTDSSARFWVRTAAKATVQVTVSEHRTLTKPLRSAPVQTDGSLDFTALLDVKGLKPFSTYYYDVLVDGKGTLTTQPPSFKTYPRPRQKARFDIVFGGGARYVPEKEHMWDVIASWKPAAFLFLGDNIYIDLPKSRTKQRVHYYRRQLRPEYRHLTASCAMYAIYDDHDFGVNDCAGGPDPFRPAWKVPAWRVFKENWVNPYYGGGDKQPGCWFDFSIGNVHVIMVDNRYYRDFKNDTMLGPVQKQWLLNKLKQSTAAFKVIASGTLWTEHADKGGKDSWWGVKEEREEIFSFIDRNKIEGVILLSADRHRTDVYKIERPQGYDMYEFETSKLTNNHTHPTKKEALFSYNKGNYFGMLTFDFTKPDPEALFRCITIENKTVYSLTLQQSQLKAK
jgi:alkaline phosphatase D